MANNNGATALAVSAELIPGFMFQTFGIGHILSGKPFKGFAIMVVYWGLQAFNALLIPLLIGLITAPLTWLGFMLLSPANLAATRGH
jgi:hypothetical protein